MWAVLSLHDDEMALKTLRCRFVLLGEVVQETGPGSMSSQDVVNSDVLLGEMDARHETRYRHGSHTLTTPVVT